MRPVIFLIVTTVLSLPWWWLSRDFGGYGYITLLMWSPAAAAYLTVKLTGGDLNELAGSVLRLRWVLAGGALTLASVSAAYAVVFALGLVEFPSPAGLAAAAKLTGLSTASPFILVLVYGALVVVAGTIRLAGPALGEEIGWRGFLAPDLCRRFGFAAGSLLSGFIWAAWHFPLMIGKVPPVQIANFAVTITGMGVVYAWSRIRSNSLWPTVFMHALHNALGDLFFLRLAASGPRTDTWLDETGFALPIVASVLAIVFIVLGRNMYSRANPDAGTR